ncbi:MAG: calcium/sodium antiporter [Bacteroides sp.]|nr:calcium/sodium antiporter [Bacillota bacterium]MCM1394091.1 calcium/sodium antiporter [[Eubacterium] siraeum]MCM1455167.1 calcium/sodium antiporter [Bacteroides sp.]
MISTLCMMEASSMAGCVILLILGILLVVKGGDWFVDAASWIAEVSGIPTFIIGATIVSLATTLPEILLSSIAASQGSAGLAIGNAIGSVNCNIALIMAISLLFIPATFKRKDYAAKMVLLLVAISVLWAVSATADGVVTWWEAIIVLVIFLAFMVENIWGAKKHASELLPAVEAPESVHNVEEKKPSALEKFGVLAYYVNKQNSKKITLKRSGMVIERKDIFKNVFLFILGAGAIFVGAQLMSDNGALFATKLGMSEDLVGVTILAVGTSLPELVTTITAIAKKKSDLSIGNVIGANIIDITLILPLCSFISKGELPISPQNMVLDFPFCLAVAGVAVIPALIMGKFKRWQGALLLAGYVTYITLLVLNTTGTICIF